MFQEKEGARREVIEKERRRRKVRKKNWKRRKGRGGTILAATTAGSSKSKLFIKVKRDIK